MISHLSLVAVPALLLLAGCEDMMGSGGTLGTGATTGIGALDVNTAATTPEGIQAAQIAAPSQASECERLALTIENSDSTEVARQAAMEDRARIGCPG